ncbi:hypothetical protein C7T94_10905 [Pedobacter yulinensis]|uniref:Uncharacterized protein n=1 Tax=Pedobacter yulinensis TaxID=2126353 RepID=A0A2T3HL46_9SPHI|nr:hypothetical protein C7T94_10905 [Pedobacter yulinensis]
MVWRAKVTDPLRLASRENDPAGKSSTVKRLRRHEYHKNITLGPWVFSFTFFLPATAKPDTTARNRMLQSTGLKALVAF